MTAPTTCTEDNAAEFNAQLRELMPEFHAFARALHQRGMIDGLRHARIAPVPPGLPRHPGAVVPAMTADAETRHLDRQWAERTREGA